MDQPQVPPPSPTVSECTYDSSSGIVENIDGWTCYESAIPTTVLCLLRNENNENYEDLVRSSPKSAPREGSAAAAAAATTTIKEGRSSSSSPKATDSKATPQQGTSSSKQRQQLPLQATPQTLLQTQLRKMRGLTTDELKRLLCEVVHENGALQDTLRRNNVELERQLKVKHSHNNNNNNNSEERRIGVVYNRTT